MTRRSAPRAGGSETAEPLLIHCPAPMLNRARLLLAPAVLAVVLFAASCGNNSPSASSQADSLIAQGLQAESTGHLQQALHNFRAAAAKDPSNAVPYYRLGAVYQQGLHDPAQAVAAYKKALSIRPKYRQALFNLAIVDTPREPKSAINIYNELLLQNPKDAEAGFNLGLLLISQSQPVPGHALLKRAITLDPSLAKRLPAGITP